VLVQVSETRVPGHDAYCRGAAVRGADFAVSMLWSSGLATDWGVQSPLVEYIVRQKRPQLSIVLAGHGYVTLPTGTLLLRPGDVVELDQRRHDDEGYGGSPCEVLVIEWDDGGSFGPARLGSPRCSRLGAADVARLRSLTARVDLTPAHLWAQELIGTLRAVGLPVPRMPELQVALPAQAARIYRALGVARNRLDRHPSIQELGESVGLSERQLRRGLTKLETDFGITSSGWREFLSDARLGWAQQLLSIPGLSMKRVAELTGFRSPVAFSHAFSARGGATPGAVARVLRERWR
jgi:AraC-like DNA-binding protein